MADFDKTLSWAMVCCYVLLNSLGALAIKQAIHRAGAHELNSLGSAAGYLFGLLVSPLVILGFVAIGLSAGAWIFALSRLELSTAYPVAVAFNCAIVVTAGFTIYGESLGVVKLTGLVLLFISVYLLFRTS